MISQMKGALGVAGMFLALAGGWMDHAGAPLTRAGSTESGSPLAKVAPVASSDRCEVMLLDSLIGEPNGHPDRPQSDPFGVSVARIQPLPLRIAPPPALVAQVLGSAHGGATHAAIKARPGAS